MAYGTYTTRNPKAVYTPARSIPLFRAPSAVFGPTATDRLVGELRNALWQVSGLAALYAKACAGLGKANGHNIAWRRKSQRDAMVVLNQARAAMRANLRRVAVLEAELLALAVPSDLWAAAAASADRA